MDVVGKAKRVGFTSISDWLYLEVYGTMLYFYIVIVRFVTDTFW